MRENKRERESMQQEKLVSVAIDGPSGAGKSTLAKSVAAELGYVYVDTGAIYRTIGYFVRSRGADPGDAESVRATSTGDPGGNDV